MQDAKVWTKDDVLALLDTNKAAVVKALEALYARQTADERATLTTRVHNGRGFNSKDATFLSDVARKLPLYNRNITDRQLARVRPMLRKYWRQLLEEIEEKGGQVDYRAHEPANPQKRESVQAPAPVATPQWGMF